MKVLYQVIGYLGGFLILYGCWWLSGVIERRRVERRLRNIK